MRDKELKFKPYNPDLFKHYSAEELLEMRFDKYANMEDIVGNALTTLKKRMDEAGEKLLLEVANPFIPLLREQGISENDVNRIARSIAIEVVRCPTPNDKWMKKVALYSGTPYYGSQMLAFQDELTCSKCGTRHLPEDPCPEKAE